MRDLTSPSVVARAPEMQAVPAEASPILSPVSATLPSDAPSDAQASAKPGEDDFDAEDRVVLPGLPSEPTAFGETAQVASIEAQIGDMGQGTGDDASRQPDVAPPPPPPAPVRPSKWVHSRARGPSVLPYAIRSNHGTWLWAPNPNGGGNG
jgi:hypothetical protein